jgi:hypothetical protein
MVYTVVWLPDAVDRLAELWIQATDRQAVRAAADRIDQRLRVDPEHEGIHLRGKWYLAERPLAVQYVVRPDDRLVHVVQVRRV